MSCLLCSLVGSTCLITAGRLIARDELDTTLMSDLWCVTLTKRGDYFWKLAVHNNNWQTTQTFKGTQLALCHCWLGVFSLLYLFWQWNKPTQAAGITKHGPGVQPWLIVTLNFLWTFQEKIPEIYLHLSRIKHVWVGTHLGPPNPCKVAYSPIQRASLSWT